MDFKVKCTKSASNYYTKGKIYEVKDGKLYSNVGCTKKRVASVEAINSRYRSKFKLVEDVEPERAVIPDFKIRCISNPNSIFIVGEIYEVINGRVKSRAGLAGLSDGVYENVNQINARYLPQFELYQEPHQFTKADLQSGDWCYTKNGIVGQVIINKIYSLVVWQEQDVYTDIQDYSDDLKTQYSSYSIEKVIRPQYQYEFLKSCALSGKVVFERKPLQLSHSTAIKELSELHGQDVEIAEDD